MRNFRLEGLQLLGADASHIQHAYKRTNVSANHELFQLLRDTCETDAHVYYA